jgi:hypothetical protein
MIISKIRTIEKIKEFYSTLPVIEPCTLCDNPESAFV